MPNLSNKLRKELFEGFGPFSSFSAKIKVAYCMKLISVSIWRDLNAVREIRNKFAHTKETLSFDHPEITKLIDKLSAPNGTSEPPADRFQSVYKNCRREIIASTSGLNSSGA